MARNETRIDITAQDKTGAAFSSVSSRLLGVEQSFSRITGMIGGLSAAAAVGFIATSVKNAADFADEMGKAAQKVGTTTEALSELKYAADLSDVSFEQLQTGLSKLAKTSEDFRNGSKTAVDAFAKINLDPTQFKDTSALLGAVADKLAAMDDGARKTAIAQELLGKSGAQLIPLLNSGAAGLKEMADEAHRFGVVVDADAAKAAEKFNDNITRLSTASKGLAMELGIQFLPALSDITEAMVLAAKESGLLMAAWVGLGGVAAHTLGLDHISQSKDRLVEIGREVADIQGRLSGGLKSTTQDGLIPYSRSEIDEMIGRLKQLGIEKAKLDGVVNPPKLPAPKPAGVEPGAITGTSKKASGKSEAEKYAEDMAKLIKAFDDASQPAQTLSEKLQAQMSAYSNLDPAVKTYLQSIVDQKKAQEEAIATAEELAITIERNNEMMAATQEYDNAAQAVYDANAQAYNDILAETQDINIAMIENDKARAMAQLEIEHERALARIDLLEGEEEQIAAIRDAALEKHAAQLKALDSKATTNKSIGKELGLTFKSAFEDAVVSGKKFGDVLDSLAQDIEKMLLRRTVTEPLMGALDGFLGGFDFGSLFNFNALGNVYSSPSLSAHSGTVVNQPTMFAFASGAGIMGEAGAEGIFPLKRGKDGKLGVSAEGGGTNVVVNLIESPGNGGQVNQQQDGNNLTIDIMVEKIESMIGRNIGQGRGIAPVMERQYGLNRAAGAY